MAMHAAKGLGALCGECRGSTAAGVATAANPAAGVATAANPAALIPSLPSPWGEGGMRAMPA